MGLQCGILLLVLNLLAGNLGDLTPPVRNFAALGLWLPVLFLNLDPPKAASWLRRLLPPLIAGIPLLVGFAAGGVHAVAALLLTLGLLQIFADPAGCKDCRFQAMLLTVAGTGLWMLANEFSPQFFLLQERVSTFSCRLSSTLTGTKFAFGPSYSGTPIFLILAWFHASAIAVSRPRRLPLFLAFLAAQLVLLHAHQVLLHTLLTHARLESPWVVLGTTQWGLLLGGTALAVRHLRFLHPKNSSAQTPAQPCDAFVPQHWIGTAVASIGPRTIVWSALATVLVVACVTDAFYPLFPTRVRPKVLFYDSGTLDWTVPLYGQYGGVRGGMFGSLAQFLQHHDCDAWRGGLTNLDQANVLVVFNLRHKFQPEENRQIWKFIARGGSLLAVGDHTGTTQIREPFNDLLRPVNIQFNFDSAMPIRRKWNNGLQWFAHPPTGLLTSAADAQIQVGASLCLGPPAEPLLIGTHGWSDNGDLQNQANGYLGDRRFSANERLGDLVLACRATYGRGNVIVFGDTTTFQNSAAARGGNFIQNIFHSLTLGESGRLRTGLRVLLVAALGGLMWSLARRRIPLSTLALTLFFCIYVGSVAGTMTGRRAARSLARPPPAGGAVVDTSHLSGCDPELWWPDGLGGVVMNLMREGYAPVLLPQFAPEAIQNSKVAFLVAPAKPFSRRETAIYKSFVRNGGQLFVCVGYEDSSGCAALLRQFGLRVRNLPLGAIDPDGNDAQVHFLNAWPVVADPPGGSQVLCRAGDYPLIVARHLGRGRLVLVGDSGFFLNRNLEMAEAFNPENIQFFSRLVPAHE